MKNTDMNFYLESINSIIEIADNDFGNNFNNRKIFSDIYEVFRLFVEKTSENSRELLTTFYSKLNYILSKYNVSKNQINAYLQLKSFYELIKNNRNITVNKHNIQLSVFLILELFKRSESFNTPKNISNLLEDYDLKLNINLFNHNELIADNFLKVVITEKTEHISEQIPAYSQFIIFSQSYGELELKLYNPWNTIYNLANTGSTLNLHKAKFQNNQLIADNNSIVVLEPDILLDTTELTNCFVQSRVIPELFFLNLFIDKYPSFSLIKGNIVNYFFDEIIQNQENDFQKLFDKSIKNVILSVASLDNADAQLNKLKKELNIIFHKINKFKSEILKEGNYSLEPTFISADYGIQGRLDLLIEYRDFPHKKDIIELKSGKAPNPDLFINLYDTGLKTGVWINHHIQTLCYNLLLESAYSKRTGKSSIYYATTDNYPIRNTPDNHIFKTYLIRLRNAVISGMINLANGKYGILNGISDKLIEFVPEYIKNDILTYIDAVKSMDKIEKKYFKLYLSFIFREILFSQTGEDSINISYGSSSIWNLSKEEKLKNFLIIDNLNPNLSESNLDKLHIIFNRNEDNVTSSMRNGDIVILYPNEIEGKEILKSKIIKGTINEINDKYISVSLRNKISNKEEFIKFDKWIIERDFNHNSLKKLFKSLFNFFLLTKEKKDLLIGKRRPKVTEFSINSENFNYLNDSQQKILTEVIKSNDYFLIQGPPGTGKTSYMLRSIVEYYHNNSDYNILLSAYTNRAIDEISNVLKKAGIKHFRLGSKQASKNKDVMISYLSEDSNVNELINIIKSTRVVLSTVSSLLQHNEIFKIKKFDLTVVDEASQILEPQIIGILAKSKKFILIGDEKQLPAVVAQPDNMNVKDDDLKSLFIHNPRNSYFERMLKICKHNNWNQSYGMLNAQARMHNDIMEFPAKYFYEKKLKIFNYEIQFDKNNIFSKSNQFRNLSESRVNFIDTPTENKTKINMKEVKIINELIYDIKSLKGKDFNENTLGIISPFRAQCAEIKKTLPFELRNKIEVDTVERFQGSEREFIIFSFSINYEEQLNNIASVTEINNQIIDRKLNVAITRAKEYLILLGNRKILSNNMIYDLLIHNIENKNCYHNYFNFELND